MSENTLPTVLEEIVAQRRIRMSDAQAKKFYEVQKNIALTGHIVDHLNTVVSKSVWQGLSDADKQIFTEVMMEAAERSTKIVEEREAKLADDFRAKFAALREASQRSNRKLRDVAEEVIDETDRLHQSQD